MAKEIDDLKIKVKERDALEAETEKYKEELISLGHLKSHIDYLHTIIDEKREQIAT